MVQILPIDEGHPSTVTTLTSTESPRKNKFRRRATGRLALLGPAFVAAIAYVDPGNVAANVSAGAEFGYLLLWVLVLANVFAVVVQYLSGKLGLVTGKSLPQLLGEKMRRPSRLAYWGQGELTAAATDVAEIIGGALALHILTGMPLLVGGLITGVISLLLLSIRTSRTHTGARRGQVAFERIIIVMLIIITLGFVGGLTVAPVDWGAAGGGLQPAFDGTSSVLLAASMLGATVMPHAIYLHSSLSPDRHGSNLEGSKLKKLLAVHRWDVVLALIVAGSVNIAMLLLAASSLQGVPGTDSIEGAHAAIESHFGTVVGFAFAIGLLFSGLASTAVGSYAGEAIMSGLLKVRISMFTRRAVTMLPALAILAIGVDPTTALILSQVVLSLAVPFALVPLIVLTSNRALMGDHVNSRLLTTTSWLIAIAIIALNALLVVLTVTGH